jgi:sugar O-acyltransferase (sialic acid O-acetyltransferase NeuD family)
MMELVLLGAGGHAREILDIVSEINAGRASIRLVGLIDERPEARGRMVAGVPVLGGFDWFQANGYRGSVTSAVGNVNLRERFVRQAADLGLSFARVISPRAAVSPSAELGAGVVVFPHAFISSQVRLGNHCHCNVSASVSHDTQVGDFAILAPGARATGRVTLGLAVKIGANATVLPGLCVGDYTVIGAGAVVTDSIESHCVAAGVPARVIRRIGPDPAPPKDAGPGAGRA